MTDLKNLQEENLIMRNEKVYKLTLTALMAALSYVVFTFLQIKIALPGYGKVDAGGDQAE